jgi:hypothetical protein
MPTQTFNRTILKVYIFLSYHTVQTTSLHRNTRHFLIKTVGQVINQPTLLFCGHVSSNKQLFILCDLRQQQLFSTYMQASSLYIHNIERTNKKNSKCKG